MHKQACYHFQGLIQNIKEAIILFKYKNTKNPRKSLKSSTRVGKRHKAPTFYLVPLHLYQSVTCTAQQATRPRKTVVQKGPRKKNQERSIVHSKSSFFKLSWNPPSSPSLTLSSNHSMKSGEQSFLIVSLLFSWETGVVFLSTAAIPPKKMTSLLI